MSEISALQNYVKSKIVPLEGEEGGSYASEIDRTLAMWRQTQATLALAEQVERIADILDSAMEIDPENPDAGRYVWVRVREE